ncbi:hypothetical protein FRC06_009036 [Ceratobasidium sp. 370]|nr:hypothetical protein FRC06_009036 [Ceratobasidium sp. 370]
MASLALFDNETSLKDLSGPHNQAKQARPPPFHPALHALLSSQQARTKPNNRSQPNGPVELSSLLEQRDWLGKLPARREKNLWWRWWRAETTKIQAPTEIEVVEDKAGANTSLLTGRSEVLSSPSGTSDTAGSGSTNSVATAKRYGLPILKTQGAGLGYRVEQFINNRAVPNPPRRSPERTQETPAVIPATATSVASLHNRFYRRRYRDVLSRMPFLSFKPAPVSSRTANSTSETQQPDTQATPNIIPGKYSVRISPLAATRGDPRNRVTYAVMSEEDRQWVQRAQEVSRQANPERKGT